MLAVQMSSLDKCICGICRLAQACPGKRDNTWRPQFTLYCWSANVILTNVYQTRVSANVSSLFRGSCCPSPYMSRAPLESCKLWTVL